MQEILRYCHFCMYSSPLSNPNTYIIQCNLTTKIQLEMWVVLLVVANVFSLC